MWIVNWETVTGPQLAQAPSEAAAEMRVRNLQASGITRAIHYEIDPTEETA